MRQTFASSLFWLEPVGVATVHGALGVGPAGRQPCDDAKDRASPLRGWHPMAMRTGVLGLY
eukprot:468837-Rhodomonas_salina.2